MCVLVAIARPTRRWGERMVRLGLSVQLLSHRVERSRLSLCVVDCCKFGSAFLRQCNNSTMETSMLTRTRTAGPAMTSRTSPVSRPSRSLIVRPPAVAAAAQTGTTYSAKHVSPPAKGKHFLHLDDFSKDELLDMLDKAKLAKSKFYARDESFKPFSGQTMAMIFTKPSARTRVSFETVSDPANCVQWLADRHVTYTWVTAMRLFILCLAADTCTHTLTSGMRTLTSSGQCTLGVCTVRIVLVRPRATCLGSQSCLHRLMLSMHNPRHDAFPKLVWFGPGWFQSLELCIHPVMHALR